MDKNKLSDILKNASKLNMSYGATLLNISKDYIKAMSEVITSEASDSVTGDNISSSKKAASTAPLLIAGREGEVANAAVAVNNTSGMSGTVSLDVIGDFDGAKVEVEPAVVSLEVDQSIIVRVLAHITDKLDPAKDYMGKVVIPELNFEVAGFVLKRLPDAESKQDDAKNTKKRQSK